MQMLHATTDGEKGTDITHTRQRHLPAAGWLLMICIVYRFQCAVGGDSEYTAWDEG